MMYNFYKESIRKEKILLILGQLGMYALVYLVAFWFNETNNVLSAILLIGLAVESYLFFAVMSKDMIDLNAVFFGIWTISIGICMFRFSGIQKPWIVSTWIDFALTPVVFLFGFYFVQQVLVKKFKWREKVRVGKITFEYQLNDNRTFTLMMICAGVSIVCMTLQYLIKGYFPLFTSGVSDRLDFYTRLIVFVSGMEATPAVCYYLLSKENIKKWKKVLLAIALIIPFITALLRLSRGEYVMAFMLIVPAVYYFSKKKILALALSVVFLMSGYYLSTTARNESQGSLDYYFQMNGYKDIGVVSTTEAPTMAVESEPVVLATEPSAIATEPSAIATEPSAIATEPSAVTEATVDEAVDADEVRREMSALESFTYFYLINGFENYNYATQVCTEYSYGLRQFAPFTVVLRFPAIREKIEQLPSYVLVKGTTKCLITDFYLDFGHWFVYVGMLLWGFAAGAIHYLAKEKIGAISMAAYGVCFAICSLGFFEPWLSNFQMWMFWGLCILLALPNVKLSKNK